MPFPPQVKEDALVACGRSCCICHKFCGLKMEVHHIREESEGGDDSAANAVPLCFDCHADMRSYDHMHPKGNKYTEPELKRHRDNWYSKVLGNTGLADKAVTVETDKHVYQLLLKILPWSRSISFISSNNFAGFAFEKKCVEDLFEFEYHCRNPAFEFIDPDLEGLRQTLLKDIDLFTQTLAVDTFPGGNPGWNSVPAEWEETQPERFKRVVSALHESARQIVATYGNLIRTATRKLGVLPEDVRQGAHPDKQAGKTSAAELRPHRLNARNALLAFADFCLTYPTLHGLDEVDRTRDLTAHIGALQTMIELLGPLSMPELDGLKTAVTATAWNLQRVLDRQRDPEAKPINARYSTLDENLAALLDWFADFKPRIKQQLDPYLDLQHGE